MRIWRLMIFGREIVRTETHDDADKTLIEAFREMIEDDNEDDEDVTEYYPPLGDDERDIESDNPELIIFRGGGDDED